MPALNFKEIPEAHLGSGAQYTFELFARDFLAHLGYEIEDDPNRGADGGKDLIAKETRKGVGGKTTVRWLVSCKHKAHSGSSVSPTDEQNIRDRVEANKCSGFIGFYSTLMGTGLAGILKGLEGKIEIQTFDKEKIESQLLNSESGLYLSKRYFPKSTHAWCADHPKPSDVFEDKPSLFCKHCNKNLLEPEPTGIIVVWNKMDEKSGLTHYNEIYWCCKGQCDKALSILRKGTDHVDGWEDIPDIAIPLVFARWVMSCFNRLRRGDTYSEDAFNAFKEFILSLYPYVTRNTTQTEMQRIQSLQSIPSYLGGLGD